MDQLDVNQTGGVTRPTTLGLYDCSTKGTMTVLLPDLCHKPVYMLFYKSASGLVGGKEMATMRPKEAILA